MNPLDNNFIGKFRLNDLLISTTDFWIISLRPEQPTIGSMVLTLNRNCGKMSELLPEETKDLALAFKKIESLLDSTFKPDKINYLALMMVDNQVHFHIIPRYKEKRVFNEHEFKDESWPKPPSLSTLQIDEKTLFEILAFLKSK